MNNPLVSVIIPTYNTEAYIAEAIDSVLAQTHKNCEIIVVDDGSKDNTKDRIRPYLDRIKYIVKPNGGPASARNVGLKEAQGDFIAFLDSDDIWLPMKLEKQLNVMREFPVVGLVACGEYHVDEHRKVMGQLMYKNYKDQNEFRKIMIVKNKVGGGSSSFIRKTVFDNIAYFDEGLRGTEDWDMWLRIALRYEVRFIEEFLIETRIRTNSVSSPENAAKMLFNELKLLDKLFSISDNNFTYFQKAKSYSYRYLVAARTQKHLQRYKDALRYWGRSFLIFPLNLFNVEAMKVLFVIIRGCVTRNVQK